MSRRVLLLHVFVRRRNVAWEIIFSLYAGKTHNKRRAAPMRSHQQQLVIARYSCVLFWIHKTHICGTYFPWPGCLLVKCPGMQMGHRASLV